MDRLSHIAADGSAQMVDVSAKPERARSDRGRKNSASAGNARSDFARIRSRRAMFLRPRASPGSRPRSKPRSSFRSVTILNLSHVEIEIDRSGEAAGSEMHRAHDRADRSGDGSADRRVASRCSRFTTCAKRWIRRCEFPMRILSKDQERDFLIMQITVGIITISDRATAGEYEDLGGPALKEAAEKSGWQVLCEAIVPTISSEFRKLCVRFRIKVAALSLRQAEPASPSATSRRKRFAGSCAWNFPVLAKRCGANR